MKNKDVTDYLSRFNVGDTLPSLIEVAEATGYERKTVREVYQRLEAFGLIRVQHGKPSVLIGDLMACEEHW